jgi:hypothetical protein
MLGVSLLPLANRKITLEVNRCQSKLQKKGKKNLKKIWLEYLSAYHTEKEYRLDKQIARLKVTLLNILLT